VAVGDQADDGAGEDGHVAALAELTASNAALTASNTELTASNAALVSKV